MQSIKENFYNLLKDKYNVYEQYPATFETLPCISYFISNVDGVFYADGREQETEYEISVDIWEKDTNIFEDVNKLLTDNDYRRTSFVNIYEDDTLINHYALRYKIIR